MGDEQRAATAENPGGNGHDQRHHDAGAEGEGFEPSVPARGTPVFKTGAFVRSANPPGATAMR
jgi:hypothetical protein